MRSIAFIDDEKNVLDGIRRTLRNRRKDWDMHFYGGAHEALDAMNEQHFDVIISDMKMPSMNGAELLGKVSQCSPDTVRICLSGFAEAEMTLESLHATHQFIAKPADGDAIRLAVERALDTQCWLNDDATRALLGGIDGLPVLPEIYDQLMQEIASEDGSIKRISEIVSSDLALTAELLKVVNSAFFGLVRHIESVEQAASILGMDTIKNIALLTCVIRAFSADEQSLAQRESLNQDGQRMGALAARIARESTLPGRAQDHSQIAAMMSVLGELIQLCYAENMTGEQETPLMGSYLLSLWNLPFPVIEAVRWHRRPGDSGIDALSPLTVVHMAWASLNSFKASGSVDTDGSGFDLDYLHAVIGEEGVAHWVEAANSLLSDRNDD